MGAIFVILRREDAEGSPNAQQFRRARPFAVCAAQGDGGPVPEAGATA